MWRIGSLRTSRASDTRFGLAVFLEISYLEINKAAEVETAYV